MLAALTIGDGVTTQNSQCMVDLAASSVSLSGNTLTLIPGLVVKFRQAMELEVDGTLTAVGTAANKIVFTSFKDDSVGGDTNAGTGTLGPNEIFPVFAKIGALHDRPLAQHQNGVRITERVEPVRRAAWRQPGLFSSACR
jgi:hypothetical protein